jgi:hypothetical protein
VYIKIQTRVCGEIVQTYEKLNGGIVNTYFFSDSAHTTVYILGELGFVSSYQIILLSETISSTHILESDFYDSHNV